MLIEKTSSRAIGIISWSAHDHQPLVLIWRETKKTLNPITEKDTNQVSEEATREQWVHEVIW